MLSGFINVEIAAAWYILRESVHAIPPCFFFFSEFLFVPCCCSFNHNTLILCRLLIIQDVRGNHCGALIGRKALAPTMDAAAFKEGACLSVARTTVISTILSNKEFRAVILEQFVSVSSHTFDALFAPISMDVSVSSLSLLITSSVSCMLPADSHFFAI